MKTMPLWQRRVCNCDCVRRFTTDSHWEVTNEMIKRDKFKVNSSEKCTIFRRPKNSTVSYMTNQIGRIEKFFNVWVSKGSGKSCNFERHTSIIRFHTFVHIFLFRWHKWAFIQLTVTFLRVNNTLWIFYFISFTGKYVFCFSRRKNE